MVAWLKGTYKKPETKVIVNGKKRLDESSLDETDTEPRKGLPFHSETRNLNSASKYDLHVLPETLLHQKRSDIPGF